MFFVSLSFTYTCTVHTCTHTCTPYTLTQRTHTQCKHSHNVHIHNVHTHTMHTHNVHTHAHTHSLFSLLQVVHLDLQHNDLIAVPPCVLTLPSLKKLNLSHNNLTSFPEVPKWSSCLLTLLLSHNTLTSIPGRPSAFSISELDLSDNKFSEVPPCVPHMRTLKTLDLRGNPITTLPPAMARLKSLTGLYLEGLRIRNVPRHAPLGEAQHCIQSISSRQPDLRPFHNMRICVLGTPKTGKSSLVAHLLGREPSQTPPTSLDVCELEVKSFGKKPLQFSVWDFSGGEALHGMHQCYLSKRTMCMVLFNLKHGTEGIEEVKFWLDSIVSRSLEVCVVVVGTHLDLVADKERSSINKLLQEVTRLGTQYAGKVALKHVVAVGLKNRIENIAAVKSAIYRCAVEHHVNGWSLMGVDVPVSYHLLHRHLSRIQRGAEHRYTMTKAEFRSIYQQLKASDFEEGGEEELSGALLFLMDMGCLAHYDSPFYNLWDLYWVDVPWLYSTLAKVSCGISHDAAVTVAEEGSLESCIVSTESIAPLLQCVQFPRQHYNQLVALLSLLKVAFPLNSHQMFVPRLLPEAMLERRDDEYFRCIRYIAFKGREPVGFWNQLLYQIVWFVPQVRLLFDKFFSREHRRAPELLLPTLPLPELVVQPRDGPPLDPTDAHLHMWQCGVFYEDSDVTFRVQSITQHAAYQVESLSLPKLMKEGVSIACTCNDFGKRMFTQLVDLVHGLLDQWDSDSRAQTVTCPECINKVPQWPFEFSMDQCLAAAATGQQSIECTHDRHKTHTVSLGNLVPELLLLHKLPGAFQSAAELVVQGRLLTMGKDVQTYQGHFRGKPVAIKCFSEPLDVRRLSKEVTLLRSISHPNIVAYAGISVPMRMILTEGTPIGTLHALLYEDNVPIPRLVVHRMAFQVSSAIQYLHHRGIVLRDLKAEGVFVWSLSPRAPTHCTLANLEHHALCSNVGCTAIKSSSSVPGVSAPEVIRGATSFSRAYERCDTSIDIFSFAMLFYQVASRRHPYHHLPSEEAVEVALETGERPELHNLPSSGAAFFYLFKLLQWCWHGDPQSRPSADHVVDVTVRTIVHSVMAVVPIPGSQSLRCACVTPPASPHGSHELWVCSESALGTGVNVYDLDTMTKVSSTFLHGFQVLGINACSKCVWISQRAGSNTSIYSTRYREPLAKVPTEFLSCMTCLESRIYCGTAEGQCLAFSTDSGYVSPVSSPDVSCSLEKAVLAMAVCQGLLWVSVQHQLYFLDLETLATVGSAPWHEDIVLSQLSVSDDGTTVWGAHLLGVTLSAWDAQAKIHMYSIDTREPMRDIAPGVSDSDVMITASVPVLDMVWVGMATGHILQFHGKELLAWFQPYNDYIRLLVRAPCTGSDQACEARVISGGKLLRTPLVGSFIEYEPVDVVGEAMDSAGILVMWEAFPAEVIKQIRSLERDHVERIKSKALEGKGSISSLGGKVPTPQIKIEEEPSVSAGPDSDIYDIPCESSLPGFLGDTTNLAGRPLPDRVVSSLSIDSPTPITDSDCDSLYEYLESPLLPLASDRQPVSQSLDVPDRSFLEDTLAVSPLANVTLHHHESRERAISSTDTLYDYPVFPLSSSVSPEHAALTSQTMKPLPPMWASEVSPIPSSDHPLLAASLTTELPGNDDGCGPIQKCPQGRVSTR